MRLKKGTGIVAFANHSSISLLAFGDIRRSVTNGSTLNSAIRDFMQLYGLTDDDVDLESLRVFYYRFLKNVIGDENKNKET